MEILYSATRKTWLTTDLHNTIFGLDHQLLRREMVDVEGHLPAVLCLLDLWHATAHLAGQGTGLLVHDRCRVHHGGHHRAHVWSQDWGPNVPRPVGGGEWGKVLRQGRHSEGLVKDSAVPVTERVPAGSAHQGEGDSSLCHGWSIELLEKISLASLKVVPSEYGVCWELRAFIHTHRRHPWQLSPPMPPELTPPTCLWNVLEYLFVADVILQWNPGGRPSPVTNVVTPPVHTQTSGLQVVMCTTWYPTPLHMSQNILERLLESYRGILNIYILWLLFGNTPTWITVYVVLSYNKIYILKSTFSTYQVFTVTLSCTTH